MESSDVSGIISLIINAALGNILNNDTPDNTDEILVVAPFDVDKADDIVITVEPTSVVSCDMNPSDVDDIKSPKIVDVCSDDINPVIEVDKIVQFEIGQSDEDELIQSNVEADVVENMESTAGQTSNENCELEASVVDDENFEDIQAVPIAPSNENRDVDPFVDDDKIGRENNADESVKFEAGQSDEDNIIQSNVEADVVENMESSAGRTSNDNCELEASVVDDEKFEDIQAVPIATSNENRDVDPSVVDDDKIGRENNADEGVKFEAGKSNEDELIQSNVEADVVENMESTVVRTSNENCKLIPTVVDDEKFEDIQAIPITSSNENRDVDPSVVDDEKIGRENNADEGVKFEAGKSNEDELIQSNVEADVVENMESTVVRTSNENCKLIPTVVDDEKFEDIQAIPITSSNENRDVDPSVVDDEKIGLEKNADEGVKFDAGQSDEDELIQSVVNADLVEDTKSSKSQKFDENCNTVKSDVEDEKSEIISDVMADEIYVVQDAVQDLTDKAKNTVSLEGANEVKETENTADEANPCDLDDLQFETMQDITIVTSDENCDPVKFAVEDVKSDNTADVMFDQVNAVRDVQDVAKDPQDMIIVTPVLSVASANEVKGTENTTDEESPCDLDDVQFEVMQAMLIVTSDENCDLVKSTVGDIKSDTTADVISDQLNAVRDVVEDVGYPAKDAQDVIIVTSVQSVEGANEVKETEAAVEESPCDLDDLQFEDMEVMPIVTSDENFDLVKPAVEDKKSDTTADVLSDEINTVRNVIQDVADQVKDALDVITVEGANKVEETENTADEGNLSGLAGENVDTSKAHEETTSSAEKITLDMDTPETIDGTNKTVQRDTPSDTPNSTPEPQMREGFYCNEYLKSKGFSLNIFGRKRQMMNLTVTPTDSENCDVFCHGLPKGMIENDIIPIFEKAGTIHKLCMIKESGSVQVTYQTEGDANNAIKTLNNYVIDGKTIKVRKYDPTTQLFVKPIPQFAKKLDIFDRFSAMTEGLVKVLLFNSPEDENKNRGFCFLEYKDEKSAVTAKRTISGKVLYGQPLFCDWPDHKSSGRNEPSLTLYIINMHARIHAADLRKIFSVYGEISEIDKTGNTATIRFTNLKDSERAANEVDKSMLGNENIDISFACKRTARRQNQTRQIDPLKNSMTPANTHGSIGSQRYGPDNTQRYGPANTQRYGQGYATANTERNISANTQRYDTNTNTERYSPATTRRYGSQQLDRTTQGYGPATTNRNAPDNTQCYDTTTNSERYGPTNTRRYGSQHNDSATTKRIGPGTAQSHASTDRQVPRKSVATEGLARPIASNENKFGAAKAERSGPRKFMSQKDLSPGEHYGSHIKSNENAYPPAATERVAERYDSRNEEAKSKVVGPIMAKKNSPTKDRYGSKGNTFRPATSEPYGNVASNPSAQIGSKFPKQH